MTRLLLVIPAAVVSALVAYIFALLNATAADLARLGR